MPSDSNKISIYKDLIQLINLFLKADGQLGEGFPKEQCYKLKMKSLSVDTCQHCTF